MFVDVAVDIVLGVVRVAGHMWTLSNSLSRLRTVSRLNDVALRSGICTQKMMSFSFGTRLRSPQPLDLRIGEAPFVVRGVVFLVRQQNVVHSDDVGVAPVERVVARAELVFEVAASGQVVVAALVGDGGRHAVVVVAHHLKEFQSDLAFAHGQRDGEASSGW